MPLLLLGCSPRGNGNELTIVLPPDEASDVLNFVLKDDATNTWYDNNSSNFRVLLRKDAAASVPKVCGAVQSRAGWA